jgi:hypothetical protein
MKLKWRRYKNGWLRKKTDSREDYIRVKHVINHHGMLVEATPQPPAPRRYETYLLRMFVISGIFFLCIFINWFYRQHTGYLPIYILLCISLGYKFLKLLFEWYHYWSINITPMPVAKRKWTVDMLTTAMPGEPYEMIEHTLKAMVAVQYPHTTYLCDEGDDPLLKDLCGSLGVVHVTRRIKINAKAGNINNALQIATGDICVVLDPDHAPTPQFLHEVLPYFQDNAIGFVQVVQAYKNEDETWIARGAAQQTYTFYGPLMMGMNAYGTVQAIGANCTFRRQALDSIGGHAAGLSEDMHTAMQLHAKGWKSVYVPKIVTRGLVPADISAYYKQQLKWSRGTFELLFTVFPKLFTKFSWRQKLHYFFLPLHFAAGIICLIDMLIPVLVLLTGEVPLFFKSNDLYWVGLPLLCVTILTRQFAQRWLLEKKEHGFHLAGGILLFGTWWIYTVGFIYTLLRVKVPYIPTPKENELSNGRGLGIPNMLAAGVCIGAVVYGLSRDWNPYNFITAAFSLLNAGMLLILVAASQQRSIQWWRRTAGKTINVKPLLLPVNNIKARLLAGTYGLFRNYTPLLAIAAIVGSGMVMYNGTGTKEGGVPGTAIKKYEGGFYTGVYIPGIKSMEKVTAFQQNSGIHQNIVSVYQAWGPASLEQFPLSLLEDISANNSVPMITWEPWVSPFAIEEQYADLKTEQRGMAAIAGGRLNDYITSYALKIRNYNKPVFIRFAHEPGNPAYPWSAAGGNTPATYIAAWKKVVTLFAAAGVSNVTWVWNPWQHKAIDIYYPGADYVDWIGITALNYGSASWDGGWRSFEEIYQPYQKTLLSLNKPVMLAEFGTTGYGGDATAWLGNALKAIRENYKEIKSLIFFNTDQDKNWITNWRPAGNSTTIDWTVKQPALIAADLADYNKAEFTTYPPASINSAPKHAVQLKGGPGNFTLLADGKPFYIKGIVYNPGHNWRDGYYPLTRKQLESDFKAIKEMGCNTIRRYHPSVYDKNILTIAREYNLKVLYGFWFDPQIDYYKNTEQVDKYIALVTQKVRQYKDDPSILAWCLGNQTGDLLANYFSQPYLDVVRHAYMNMIEKMAGSLHAIDDQRAVTTTLEYSNHLPAALLSYKSRVPSVDIVGINTYFKQQVRNLDSIVATTDSTRPYLVTEFGPAGYWNSSYTIFDDNNLLKELTSQAKAEMYTSEWKDDIAPHKGYNAGGIAYCWKDRFEGSATWWGVTDFKGRRKSSYYALQDAWLEKTTSHVVPKLFIVGPTYRLKPGAPYEFTAVCTDTVFSKIEWYVLREDYSTGGATLRASANKSKTWVTLPPGAGGYRLYAYLIDTSGNVTTASMPVMSYNGIYNSGL